MSPTSSVFTPHLVHTSSPFGTMCSQKNPMDDGEVMHGESDSDDSFCSFWLYMKSSTTNERDAHQTLKETGNATMPKSTSALVKVKANFFKNMVCHSKDSESWRIFSMMSWHRSVGPAVRHLTSKANCC
jgi:hypothetical protein